jgi:Family of unknown function (DUF6220)
VKDATLRTTLPDGSVRRLALGAFRVAAWGFVGCLVIQFFLVGLDVFDADPGELHRDFAYTYGWLTPGLVLLAGLARVPRRLLLTTLLLLVLFGVQTYLPTIADRLPWLASFHSVLALAIVWLAVQVARTASRIPAESGTVDR